MFISTPSIGRAEADLWHDAGAPAIVTISCRDPAAAAECTGQYRKHHSMSSTTGLVRPGTTRLRGDSLNFLETIGQSIANVAPTCTPALNITVVAGMAGTGTWLAYLIATIGMLFVAGNIGVLARRHPMAGSYFVYISRTLGPLAGMMAGWSMIAAYTATAIAITFGSQIFLSDMLRALGFAALVPPSWLFNIVFVALIWLLAYRDIRVSARAGLYLEFTSLAIITIITAVVLFRHGGIANSAQLDITHMSSAGVMSALAFAVFSFVGFESAATLAKESRDPTRMIPLAVTLSAGLAGLFFVVIAYAMVVAVGDQANVLAASASPFAEITRRAGIAWAAAIVYASALISGFACCLACLNAVSRMMFSMGRYEFIAAWMGSVHKHHQTPHYAISAAAASILLICLLLSGLPIVLAFGTMATFGTFGFLVIYLLISVVAPLDMARAGILKPRHAVLGCVGVILMAFVIFGSLYPVPEYPYNLLPYLFVAYLLSGAAWYAILAARSPSALLAIQNDLEL
jgi:amino acid transporter